MKGYRTTFLGLFDASADGRPSIHAIQIPIIQRDFAQGRRDDATAEKRERFVDGVVRAASSDVEMGLDFVWGDLKDGVLLPLDGQQRLTTLFLLHWYVVSRAGRLDPDAPWLRFSYETRPSAREFCVKIAKNPYPDGTTTPSEWITDQPWYVYPWRNDPTISSMLVMLDAIHERMDHGQTDFAAVWDRLANREKPAIWFLFLPVTDMEYGEDLYIKMNSRGKPLTPFEVFKADLEGALKPVLSPGQHKHLTECIDGSWADLLWEYAKASGGDLITDDEFMRYLAFIIDVCDWRDGHPDRRWRDKAAAREWPITERARLALADPENRHARRNRGFFFHAFDTWIGASPSAEFAKLFTAGGQGGGPLPLLVSTGPDLFGSCITRYGSDGEFSFAETLMLFAVLLARQADPPLSEPDLNRRLRTLRNLAESAFLERKRMTEYVATVENLLGQSDSALDKAQGFNQAWLDDELNKWQLMDAHPEVTDSLHLLEDQMIIRGRLLAFERDAETIPSRASAFAAIADHRLRDAFGAALLTKGDYSREVGWNGKRRQLGSSGREDSWRDLLTTGTRGSVARTRAPLTALLDDVSARLVAGADPAAALDAICSDWLTERQARQHFDWRYYFVRYQGARSSMGEGYFANEGYDESRGGFAYGRIRMLSGSNYAAYFSDALLRAAWHEGDLREIAEEPWWWHRDDPGMRMGRSAVEIRCVDKGLELVLPEDDAAASAAAHLALQQFPGADGNRLIVAQEECDSVFIDSEDRVKLCIRLAHALHDSGL